MIIAYHQNPEVWLRCKGVIFLGTPHRGSAAAEIAKMVGDTLNKAWTYSGAQLFLGGIRTNLLEDLSYGSPKLASVTKEFQERAAVLLIHSFYENEITPPTGRVVSTVFSYSMTDS